MDRQTTLRLDSFLKCIFKNKSPNLRKMTIDLFKEVNFIHCATKTIKECQNEVAISQLGFVRTLKVGNVVHLCKETSGSIEIGRVKEINDLTLTLFEVEGLRNLSEIQTIDFSNTIK